MRPNPTFARGLEELRRQYAPDVEIDVSQLSLAEVDHFLNLISPRVLAEVRHEDLFSGGAAYVQRFCTGMDWNAAAKMEFPETLRPHVLRWLDQRIGEVGQVRLRKDQGRERYTLEGRAVLQGGSIEHVLETRIDSDGRPYTVPSDRFRLALRFDGLDTFDHTLDVDGPQRRLDLPFGILQLQEEAVRLERRNRMLTALGDGR